MSDNLTRHSYYFLIFCLAALLVIIYFVIQPFLSPLILAGVFAFLFQPVYHYILSLHATARLPASKRAGLSAFATTVVAIVSVLIPITLLGTLILKESTEVYQALVSGTGIGLINIVENMARQVIATLPVPEHFDIDISQYARQGLAVLASSLGNIFSSFAKMTLSLFVFLTAFYFLLRDGQKLKDYFIALSPLADNDDKLIISRLESAVSATIKGNLMIGLIQGALTGIGFAIFGVPNAILWGSVAAVTALIPGIGTALVIAPAVIFLFLTGATLGGAGLLIWGITAVGLIDNFLGPKFVGGRMQLHPLAVFLAVLGGMAFFGPLGFLLGPLAMSVCLALIDIYFSLGTREGVPA